MKKKWTWYYGDIGQVTIIGGRLVPKSLFGDKQKCCGFYLRRFFKELRETKEVMSWMANALKRNLRSPVRKYLEETIRGMEESVIPGIKEDIRRVLKARIEE